MLLDLPTGFDLQDVTKTDMAVASLAWGFTLGFGFLTTWTAIKQTHRTKKRNSPYIWMIWLEIAVSLAFSIICWLHLNGNIPPSFAFFFCILTLWALQVQFLLQIIINRVMILLPSHRIGRQLRLWVAVLITAINISVYCIWVPARMQISDRYVRINVWWDRCEKIIYLLVDAALNILFIRTVKHNLVENGLQKYKKLARFNTRIIAFSLSMDVLIIGMMSLSNTFVYMQFHPLAYIVKLKIEMSMADLITRVARSQDGSRDSVKAPRRRSSLAYHRSSTYKPNTIISQASVHEMNVPKRSSHFGHDDGPYTANVINVSGKRDIQRDNDFDESGEVDMNIYATHEVSVASQRRDRWAEDEIPLR